MQPSQQKDVFANYLSNFHAVSISHCYLQNKKSCLVVSVVSDDLLFIIFFFFHKGIGFLTDSTRREMLMLGLSILTKRSFMFRTNSIISINISRSQLCNIPVVEKGCYKLLQLKNGLSSRLPR